MVANEPEMSAGLPLADVDWIFRGTDKDGKLLVRVYTHEGRSGTRLCADETTQKTLWEWVKSHYAKANFIWLENVYFRPDALEMLAPVNHPEAGPSLQFSFRGNTQFTQPFHDWDAVKAEHVKIISLLSRTHGVTLIPNSESPHTIH